jgi:hypothetical protein
MGLLRQIPTWLRQPAPALPGDDRLRRRDALVEAAVALASEVADGGLDGVMHQTVRATADISGAAAVLILLNGDDGPERLAADGVDRSTREAVSRKDVLGPLVEIAGSVALSFDLGPVRERLRPFGGDAHVATAPDAQTVIAFEIPHASN